MNNFTEVDRQKDGLTRPYEERWIRHVEWETALVFLHDLPEGQKPTYSDRDCLIIAGDRREELNDMPKEQLRDWYAQNIDGNRNSMETIIEVLRDAQGEKP